MSEPLDIIVVGVRLRYHKVSLSFQSGCFSDPLWEPKHFRWKNKHSCVKRRNLAQARNFHDSLDKKMRRTVLCQYKWREQIAMECALPCRLCTPVEALMYKRQDKGATPTSARREKALLHWAPIGTCLTKLGGKGSGGPDAHGTLRQSAEGPGRLTCALEMEMTNYNQAFDSKLDGVNYEGLITRNGGGGGGEPAAEVSVPLTQRSSPMEGDNLYRLRDRKFLLEDKKRLCALSLGTAVLGIVLMIIHAETCPFLSRVGV